MSKIMWWLKRRFQDNSTTPMFEAIPFSSTIGGIDWMFCEHSKSAKALEDYGLYDVQVRDFIEQLYILEHVKPVSDISPKDLQRLICESIGAIDKFESGSVTRTYDNVFNVKAKYKKRVDGKLVTTLKEKEYIPIASAVVGGCKVSFLLGGLFTISKKNDSDVLTCVL